MEEKKTPIELTIGAPTIVVGGRPKFRILREGSLYFVQWRKRTLFWHWWEYMPGGSQLTEADAKKYIQNFLKKKEPPRIVGTFTKYGDYVG